MNLKNKWFPDLVFIGLLLVLAYIPWRYLPELVIRGDGFVYMVSSTIKDFFNRDYFYTGFELSAGVFGWLLPKLYKTNISYYFYTSLFVMMVINILFYILLQVITKHKLISFFGALLFAVNYFGNFDMYSQHCYCFFIERIIPVIFMIPAFIFLHLFLEKQKTKYYLTSLLFYFVGIGMGHFSVLFTAPYLLYPLFWYLFKNKNKIPRIKAVLIGGSYLLISGFFVLIQRIHESGFEQKFGLIEYLLKPQITQYPEKILRQLAYWSEYIPTLRNIEKPYLYGFLEIKHAVASTPYIVILYAIAAFVIYKKLPSQRALLLTTIFGTVTIFYLNAWFGQYDVFFQPGANRYLYFPTFLLVIFWMLFLWILWKSKHIFMKLAIIVLVFVYYFINSRLISDTLKDILFWDRSTKVTYNHMNSMRGRLPKGTLVVAPYPEVGVYESKFFTEQIGGKDVEFLAEYHPYKDWNKVATLSAMVIKLHYDKRCDCIKEQKIK